jgi:hypothetical protein
MIAHTEGRVGEDWHDFAKNSAQGQGSEPSLFSYVTLTAIRIRRYFAHFPGK